MGLTGTTQQQNTSPGRLAALGLFVLALGLLGWRSMAVFTLPGTDAPAAPFAALVETMTGAGTLRIGTGETGQMLILIDGETGSLSNANLTQIRQMAIALYPAAPAPTITQYPFATGAPARPSMAALGELAALGLLTVIAGWFALTPGSLRASSWPMERSIPSRSTAERHPARPAPAEDVDAAMALAAKDPRAAAAIIQGWLRHEGRRA